MKLLFATSEAYPLLKTGGLGDISNSLPNSLVRAGVEVRLVLPAYRDILQQLEFFTVLGWLHVSAQKEVRILEASHKDFSMPLLLVDDSQLFDRGGNPYTHPDGFDWPDNPERFATFSHAVALLAVDGLGLGWRADVVHANDWQCGLVPAYLSHEAHPPKRVFTIHNIAYDCQFDYGTFQHLRLPPHWWSMDYGEFYDRFSMLKAGLVFSDVITTVSPSYAREICTPEYGYGYASILQTNCSKLHGILNGIDTEIWNPRSDPYLAEQYPAKGDVQPAKHANKQALLKQLGADDATLASDLPLIGFVGRLVFQKGVDLLLAAIEHLLPQQQARFVIIGSGEYELETELHRLCDENPQQVFSYVGYSEQLAHLLEAGCDIFAMPSRYEPCGLNQLYSLQYGTPPVVRKTGGLADTVIHADEDSIKQKTASGVVFDTANEASLSEALLHAISLYGDARIWPQIMQAGMQQDFSWDRSAQQYVKIYQRADI
ncbi:MAG: glycogen synthase GlgA [Chromatiales bacterium]|jgi:starch synthase